MDVLRAIESVVVLVLRLWLLSRVVILWARAGQFDDDWLRTTLLLMVLALGR